MTQDTIINSNSSKDAGTLAPSLGSAVSFQLADIKSRKPSTGHYFARFVAMGINKTLAESLAVELPLLGISSINEALKHESLVAVLQEALQRVAEAKVRKQLQEGSSLIQYSDLTVAQLATFAVENNVGIGQLSEDAIATWFTDSMLDMLLVALADKIGVSENATPGDLVKLEQIAEHAKGSFKKLASKKPVVFNDRDKAALNWMLDTAPMDDDTFAARLRGKLNAPVLPAVEQINLADSLGF